MLQFVSKQEIHYRTKIWPVYTQESVWLKRKFEGTHYDPQEKKKELFFIMESLAKFVVKQLFLCISQYFWNIFKIERHAIRRLPTISKDPNSKQVIKL